MQAFLGKASIKREYLSRVRAHRKADQLIHGVYWEKGKGCAVGCTVHSGNHGDYETQLGIPRILARLEDGIFESLSNGKAQEWPERFLSAIKPGADLSLVWPKFAVWMLIDAKYGVLQFAKNESTKKAIQDVADAYQGVADGKTEKVNWERLRDAAYDAYAAHATAAYDAYAAYASYAAYAAALAAGTFRTLPSGVEASRAAHATAAYAAYAAAAYAAYAAYAAKRQEWRVAQSDKLIKLLKAA